MKTPVNILFLLILVSTMNNVVLAAHSNHTHNTITDGSKQCKCIVMPTDGQCPATEPAMKWKLAEKSMFEDKEGNKRMPVRIYSYTYIKYPLNIIY